MATSKKKIQIYVSEDTFRDMELLYNGLHGVVTQDAHGRLHVDVSRSVYWESVIRDYLKSQGDLVRVFRMKKEGKFSND